MVTSLERRCLDVFEAHRRFAFDGTFHVPDVTAYPELFAWDSGYHALALRHLDPGLARLELQTLYRANQREDGLLAHQRPLPDDPGRVEAVTRAFGPLYRDDGVSWLIDPPVAAFAVVRMFETNELDRDLLARATLHLDAIWDHRIPRHSDLPVILHPFESGTEGTPLTDTVLDMTSRESYAACLKALTVSAVACRLDVGTCLRRGHRFVVEDPVFCGWYLVALEECARAWEAVGDRPRSTRLWNRAESTAAAIARRLWWDEAAIVAGYDVRDDRPLRAVTAGGLVCAVSSAFLRNGMGERMLDRYLRPGSSPLWGPWGIAFNPVDPARPARASRYWRGNVVWGATAYWAHLALVRSGRMPEARRARRQMERLVREHGFREHYDAVTGEGGGAGSDHGFTWPALVLEMRAQEQTHRP